MITPVSDYVQSFARGLSVIKAFHANDARGLTLARISRLTGLPRATVRRLLLTLEQLGYVTEHHGNFELTPRILDLVHAYLTSADLPRVAMPVLEQLSNAVVESSSVSVLEDTVIVYVARVRTKSIMSVSISVGSRFPAYRTSMGQVLLAHLPEEVVKDVFDRSDKRDPTQLTIRTLPELQTRLTEVRHQGWALVDQELEVGIRSVAAPLHDANGTVVAAINVSSTASKLTKDEMIDTLLPPLLAAASAISRDLSRLQRSGITA